MVTPPTIKHGGSQIPPTRLCTCGHTWHVHERTGHCNVVHGCDCTCFTEPDQPYVYQYLRIRT